jgi:ferredoxin
MTGIFYFSATGNSLYVAQCLQSFFGGSIRYIPNYEGNGEEYDRIIIVSPIYSFGLPVHVYDFIPRLTGKQPVWVVLNYGGMAGGADLFAYRYAREHGVNIQGVFTVKMPENYTLTFSAPSFYTDATLKAAPKAIDAVAQRIKNAEPHIPRKKPTLQKTYLKNRPTWHLIANDFSVSSDCVQCGKCVELCPTQNISLENGKISFADRCVICLGCYHRCPKKAIRYKNYTKQDRYINPHIREADIGKDL